jgi:hypothetical protein
MQVHYQVAGATHTFDPGEAQDLGTVTRAIEDHLRENHTELAAKPYLTEKVTDGLLNALAGDSTDVQLGELS